MLCLGQSNNLIKGIYFPNNRLEVLNIQYTDDTLLFLSPSNECIINLTRILCYFQACSRLKINFHKSSLTRMGLTHNQSTYYSLILGCEMIALPITYLRLPFHFKKAFNTNWMPILDKLNARLECWKGNLLSLGGRITVLKFVLSYSNILPLDSTSPIECRKGN